MWNHALPEISIIRRPWGSSVKFLMTAATVEPAEVMFVGQDAWSTHTLPILFWRSLKLAGQIEVERRLCSCTYSVLCPRDLGTERVSAGVLVGVPDRQRNTALSICFIVGGLGNPKGKMEVQFGPPLSVRPRGEERQSPPSSLNFHDQLTVRSRDSRQQITLGFICGSLVVFTYIILI